MKSLLVLSTLLIAGSASAVSPKYGFCKNNDYVSGDLKKKYCTTENGRTVMNYSQIEADFGLTKRQANRKFVTGPFNWDKDVAKTLRELEAKRVVRDTIGTNNSSYIEYNQKISAAEKKIRDAEESIKLYEKQELDKTLSTQQYQDKQAECSSLSTDYTQSKKLTKCNNELAKLAEQLTSLDESREAIKAAKVQRARNNLALQTAEIEKSKSEIEKAKKNFDKAYNGILLQGVKDQFSRAGKNFESIQSASNFCYSEISADDSEQLKETCDKLITGIDAANEFNKKYEDTIEDLDKVKNPLKVLGMELDASLMKDKYARQEILGKAKDKLKGTVMGALMNQMSSDMCNIAQNTEAMCPGAQNADLTSFVSNAVEAAKQADVIPDLPNLEDTSSGTFVESVPIGK